MQLVLLKVRLIILLCDRRAKHVQVRNVKVIPNEECVPKHKLLVMDMQFNTTKRWHKKFEPRVHVCMYVCMYVYLIVAKLDK